VVEVLHDVFHALPLDADQVCDGDFDVVELDECCSSGRLPADFYAAHRYAARVEEGDDQHGEPGGTGPAGADRHAGVFGPETVGYPVLKSAFLFIISEREGGEMPFLRPVNNKMFPILRSRSRCADIRHIAPGSRFRDRDTDPLLPRYDIRHESLL